MENRLFRVPIKKSDQISNLDGEKNRQEGETEGKKMKQGGT